MTWCPNQFIAGLFRPSQRQLCGALRYNKARPVLNVASYVVTNKQCMLERR